MPTSVLSMLTVELQRLDIRTKEHYGIRTHIATLPLEKLRSLAKGDKKKWGYICKEIALETRERYVIVER